MANTVSAGEGARAGYGFIRQAWRGAPGALVLSAVAAAAYLYVDFAGLGRGALAATLLFSVAVGVIAQGALLRLALKLDGLGPAGLQWRGLETRLLGLTLLTALLFAVVVLVLIIVILCVVLGLSMAGGGRAIVDDADWIASLGAPGAIALVVISLGGAAFIMWLSLRLSLAPAATAVAGRIQLLNTFDLTKGRVWPILGAFIIVGLPIFAIAFVGGALSAMGEGAAPGGAALAVAVVSGLLTAFVYTPAAIGLIAYLHGRLAPAGDAR
ncbi:hypothetical protein [Caulobacter mirabilis]|uniref:Glycerophosphoryl diester phosphodiesterase membrane domain-containing protein n=1 Tax=Caulobacter mirabilis TaxID=69666 RepID=A0A2D2AWX7_9CAUL|nr:hypothetical protein [Caulobacter mirabilis]ATQ42481.1 hypothetical protein CSW64_08665 [Caulobacter mirabilis]